MPSASERHADGGFATLGQLLATLLTLVAFTAMVNVVVAGYGRGVVRAALDEGVRAGARAGDAGPAVCEQRARAVLADLLGGSLGDGVDFHGCALEPGRVLAGADVRLPGWLPLVRGWHFRLEATAVAGRTS